MVEEIFEYNQHFVSLFNILNMAKKRGHVKGDYQKHHIIPRSYYKLKGIEIDNSENNLVYLTYEEHLKVHKLMTLCVKIAELKRKMIWAYNFLKTGKVLLPSNRSGKNNPMFGNKQAAEKIRQWALNMSDEHKKKISDKCKTRYKIVREDGSWYWGHK